MPKRKDSFWEYAEDLKNGRFRCKFCKDDFPGGISRIKSHLSGLTGRDIKICEKVPIAIQLAVVQAFDTPGKKAICLGASNSMLENTELFLIPASSSHNISNAHTEEHKLRVDKHLAKLFMSEGICSKVLQSPFFNDFVKDIIEYGPSYQLPSSLTLESQPTPDVSKEVREYIENVHRSSGNTGCTVIYNRWAHQNEISEVSLRSDTFLYTSGGVAYLKSYNQKPGCLPTTILTSTIESIGPKNIVQIMFDLGGIDIDRESRDVDMEYGGDAEMSSTMKKLSKEYPWICLAYCATEIIDLLMSDIIYSSSVYPTINVAQLVVSFIYKYKIKVPLKRVKTRWQNRNACNSYLLRALLEVEDKLKSLQTSIALLSSDSVELLDDEQKEAYLRRAKLIDYIIHCKEFWTQAKVIAQILLPVFQTHCLVESIGSTSGYLYEMMERVKDAIEKCRDSNCTRLYDNIWPMICIKREDIIHPMHAAAAFLNPAYMCSENFKENDEMMEGINYLLEVMVVKEEKASFMKEFQQYRMKVSNLFTTQARIMLETSHPRIWWDYCGKRLPILRKYALQLLSQPCSSTGCKQLTPDNFDDPNQDQAVFHDINTTMMGRFKQVETQMLEPIILDKLGEVYGELNGQHFCYDDTYFEYVFPNLSDSVVDGIINDKTFSWLDGH